MPLSQKKNALDFVDDIICDKNKNNIRFLKYYDRVYIDRQKKWLKSNPTDLFEANVRRFKYLLALNLSGKTLNMTKMIKASSV